MKKHFKIIVATFILFLGCQMYSPVAQAQCAMCSQSAKTAADKGGNKAGAGINNGIFILLVLPYIAAAVVGGIWYRNTRRKRGVGF